MKNTENTSWELEFDKAFPRDHDLFVEGKTKVKQFFKETLQRTRLEMIEECAAVVPVGGERPDWKGGMEEFAKRALVAGFNGCREETLKNLRALRDNN